ncbi:ribonuclease H-like domain-containing protein [Halteromyces radiatus]|uniref:ribonuclease H-like domain-containing protein n=1 Tax=Halteromyces radiatus TaxID=101107 RepID=UPI00221FB8A9|nr:ribonuclease H-like domain-containing protein [Halteromyces radiatus]KAI8085176.1 ribonuclease H-like domain-containing protein [Halteromyces radiatus]
MAVSTLGGFTSGAFIAALSCPFELVKIQKQLEFLLQASSVSTGATVVRSLSENDIRPSCGARSTINRTVGAGMPISPLSNPSSTQASTSTSTSLVELPYSISTSSWASAKEIIRKKGITALYNGFGLHFLRDSVGTGVYFGAYETTKYLLTKKNEKAGPLTQFLAGGICGILCWLVVFPIDLVKTLKQKEILSPSPLYSRVSDCVANIARQKGYMGFYSGISVTLLRAFPIHSLNFLLIKVEIRYNRLDCPTFVISTTNSRTRGNFTKKLPLVKEAINECDFMAIDTELSGLYRPGTGKRIETLDYRYQEFKEATERFTIIQFGLCTFKWDQPSGRYIAKPFNFYIFPTSFAGGRSHPNRVFHVQAQAFDFLAKQTFDFNKWVYQGIPFMNLSEEQEFIKERTKMFNDEIPDIPVDDKELGYLNAAREKINAWLKTEKLENKNNNNNDGVNIETANGYQRRIIYQDVRNNFEGLVAEGRKGFIKVMRLNEKQKLKRNKEREELYKNDCEKAVGFRKVIDWISESKKPLVGHNMFLDICHVIGQFIQPLPDTKEEFKLFAHTVFPIMIDTKYIAISSPEIMVSKKDATDLENLRFETSRNIFKNPRIDVDWEYPRYLEEKAHEAGYDAYLTGTVFLKLLSYLKEQNVGSLNTVIKLEEEIQQDTVICENSNGGWDCEPDDDVDPKWTIDENEVYNYGSTRVELLDKHGDPLPHVAKLSNKAVMVRSAYRYFDFTQPETCFIKQSNAIVVHRNKQALLDDKEVEDILSTFGQYIMEDIDDNTTLVVYDRVLAGKDTVEKSLLEKFKSVAGATISVESIIDYLD